MTEEERALNGLLFDPGAPELVAKKAKAHRLSQMFNNLFEEQQEERCVILRELLGELGDRSLFHGPLRFHYGCHTRIGRNCFFNFNLTIQDDSAVTIGNDCNFGPNVTIVTPVHPMLANERRLLKCSDGVERHLCFAKPVTIGDDCWVGANVVICPGVTIGNGCVIGAGSVVTRDVPPDSFAAGNPARVIREITEKDSIYLKFDEIY
ncbi:MAG: sugar O-acetyltransferase [Oscillospiraceae bacterium]|nr:sugar O-acetyltransferase [Oscillospiraceae bacterium]MBO7727308.1 sugar O-acetyltransferase [Oscillospiraceae bacterium]MBP5168798.1 sugar O-acetyltransferase [Oscillospiraceae bacterium]